MRRWFGEDGTRWARIAAVVMALSLVASAVIVYTTVRHRVEQQLDTTQTQALKILAEAQYQNCQRDNALRDGIYKVELQVTAIHPQVEVIPVPPLDCQKILMQLKALKGLAP